MGLLKYLGKQEVISVEGERGPTRRVMDGPFVREENHYPVGTERTVKKFFYLPRTIGGVKVRGSQTVRRVCRHEKIDNHMDTGIFQYERWDDQEVLAT